ncbi:putative membrane protein [Cesiribacter andamanensis AMV16]|uniref:Putative membrane protein n=1 Tax=Cesiribacter andamanensis AMV16 TaxID=1279009 RepID=M7NWP3_9BACT|nr:putative membrane protein [Cesiribacter andamanensis AMV16]
MHPNALKAYWRRNLRYVLLLLLLWFLVSFGCGILWAEELNALRLGGFKLGFWFAQQGAIYAFVMLIFVYVGLMNRLDRAYNVHEQAPLAPDRPAGKKRPDPNSPQSPSSPTP